MIFIIYEITYILITVIILLYIHTCMYVCTYIKHYLCTEYLVRYLTNFSYVFATSLRIKRIYIIGRHIIGLFRFVIVDKCLVLFQV